MPQSRPPCRIPSRPSRPRSLPHAALLRSAGPLLGLTLAPLTPGWAQSTGAAAPAAAAASAALPAEAAASAPPPATRAATPSPSGRQQLDRVEVSGGASDTALRRASTASKIVIGREEIERFGDASVAEVLKRLPGVTTGGRPGRGGDIRMRGMGGGYTQILVNGERMPPSFSLDQIAPDQIERIEVSRAPTAETGARAVAGSINIVLREALQKRLNDLRLALTSERGMLRPQIAWTRNDKFGDAGGAYNLTAAINEFRRLDDVNTRVTTQDLGSGASSVQHTSGSTEERRRSLNLNARLQWPLGGGDMLTLFPFAVLAKGSGASELLQQPANAYDQAQTHSDNRFNMLRVNGMLARRLDESTRLELRGGVGRAALDSDSQRQEWLGLPGALLPSRTQTDQVGNRDRSWSLNGKASRQLESEHSLVAGLEAEGTRRSQTRSSLVNGLPRPELAEFGDALDASTLRLAAYAQDEWNPSPQWSAYAGLRWEGIRTSSSAANYQASNRSGVWTPLLHAVWKPEPKSRDQLRMSLTRSYRAPNVQDLIARPSINSQFPTGANTANYADRAGNPDLRPEMATGIDLAAERYLSKGGVLSVSVFARRISDLMRTVTSLETVSWSSVPRWVARPTNIGNARTQGVELEAKFRLDELFDDAAPVSVRSNLSLFRSSVDGIPGPNNRLDQQPRATANLGADYRLRSLPLTLGASLNWTPANTVQQTLTTETSSSRKRVTDAFALWNVNRDVALRLSASNLAPLDYLTSSIINTGDQLISTENLGRTFTQWQLRMEIKL